MRLGADGESVILTGSMPVAASAGFPLAAVRYAWRAYPCEVLGCVHEDRRRSRSARNLSHARRWWWWCSVRYMVSAQSCIRRLKT